MKNEEVSINTTSDEVQRVSKSIFENNRTIRENIVSFIKGLISSLAMLELTPCGSLLNVGALVLILANFAVSPVFFGVAGILICAQLFVALYNLLSDNTFDTLNSVFKGECFDEFDFSELKEKIVNNHSLKKEIKQLKTNMKKESLEIEDGNNQTVTFNYNIMTMLYNLVIKTNELETSLKLDYLQKIKEIMTDYNNHVNSQGHNSETVILTTESYEIDIINRIANLEYEMERDIVASTRKNSVNEECSELSEIIDEETESEGQHLKLTLKS